MFLAIVVFAIVIPFSSLIFNIWIGQTSVFQVGTFQIMCIWVAFSTLASPGYLFLLGKGNSKAILVIQAASSLAAVIIMFIPIGLMRNYPWEFIGFSYAIFGIISFIATLLYTNRNFDWSIYKMLKVILPAKLTIVGICLSLLVFILAAAQAESRLYQALLFTFTGFCLIGLLLYTMPIEEKNIIRKYILHLRKSA
jgi:O-antigen/teichoic acid export membrane protein